ncbi:cytochrome c [Pararhodobacter sp. SW119]|uniref:c-type cytochrome n=1 Tax=Pararhodobacter sp. SW119 TaxID=2780075 RepID=UPI001ADEE342|nr:cytochrome c [Pararhodobacter sp. SW119]
MRRIGWLVLIAASLGALLWWLARPSDLPDATRAALDAHRPDPAHGERIFWATGCAGCHAPPDLDSGAPPEARLVLSGGRRLESPFGTFVAPNVSPDPVNGIGDWSLHDFARAMLRGVSPEGAHYYPAFPYTSYLRARPEDVADLWAFWQTLPAVETPSAAHELPFPFTIRSGLGIWKFLNMNEDFVFPGDGAAPVMRGRYLVEALGHCAECHTPRNLAGGLDVGRWMAGAPNPSGDGRIPRIPDPSWSAEDIEAYLFSGFTPDFDVVGGSMADVVQHMAQLPAEDRAAIAAYLRALVE